jgi:hypothetical protein
LLAATAMRRHDGLCFNQRYFHELAPLAAMTFAWTLERVHWRASAFVLGGVLGSMASCAILLMIPTLPLRDVAILKFPLLLAVASVVTLWLALRNPAYARLLSCLAGACLAWSLLVHVIDDVPAARAARTRAVRGTVALRKVLPQRAALLVWGYFRNYASPLQLDRDLVIADAARDGGKDAALLVDAWLAQGRPVFVVANDYPRAAFELAVQGHSVTLSSEDGITLARISEQAL